MIYNNFKKSIKHLLNDLETQGAKIKQIMKKINTHVLPEHEKDQIRRKVAHMRAEINLTVISIWTGCRFDIDTSNKKKSKICCPFYRRYVNGGNFQEISLLTGRILAGLNILVSRLFKENPTRVMFKYTSLKKDFIGMKYDELYALLHANLSAPEMFHMNKLRKEFGKEIWKIIAIYGAVIMVVGVCGYFIYVRANDPGASDIAHIAIPDVDIDSVDFSAAEKALESIE